MTACMQSHFTFHFVYVTAFSVCIWICVHAFMLSSQLEGQEALVALERA